MAKRPSGSSEENTEPYDGLAGLLLAWYEQVKRPLPWRQDNDPYRVWLSEVMLQQTRVETAIPYYERFLRSFPSVEALAGAREDEVQALWSGLGYYRRARMLLLAAKEVVLAGGFPRTTEGWRRLPGVGSYTAAAVMSIVHGERALALDGNIERVLARLTAYDKNPKSAAGRRFLAQAAEGWLDAKRPGDSNQALMELGATTCLPRNPLCHRCPIAEHCVARRLEEVGNYPYRPRARRKEEHALVAVCVWSGNRLLLFRRDLASRLLAGTWELPWVDSDERDPCRALTGRYGGRWKLGKRVGSIRHTITRRNFTVTVNEGEFKTKGIVAQGKEARWSSLAELEQFPHSSLVRKVFLVAGNQ